MLVESLWGKGEWKKWETDQVNWDGLLNDDWFIPDTDHFLDAEKMKRIETEWRKYRAWYETARQKWDEVVAKQMPFTAPPDGYQDAPPSS